ncbi:MAG: Rieske 2Fe-2S domain-containing protein [Streptosporangiales bacterium]|nr:Rieske 2Fe-2S domain-containing protein [Streptosporangiales bacterium]
MSTDAAAPATTGHVVCPVSELPPGTRRVVSVGDTQIGVFNVAGEFYALRNRCPHKGGALCEGPITGTTLPTSNRTYTYGRSGEIVRCAWHGWEFEIATGVAIVDPRIRTKSYPVTVDDDQVVVHL